MHVAASFSKTGITLVSNVKHIWLSMGQSKNISTTSLLQWFQSFNILGDNS
jgi:hypothetical protein